MKNPLISIVITTFNRPKLLKNAIKSAISQSYKNLQIIVSDDGIGDENLQIAFSFNDDRIEYYKNDKHTKSPNGNKNNGFDKVKGEYLCLLDDDDELLDDAIFECYEIIKTGYDSVFADCICEEKGTLTDKISGSTPYINSTQMDKIDYHCGNFRGEFFKLFSVDFIKDFRFDESSFGGENELYIRFFEKKAYYYKKPLYLYRINRDDSATKNAYKNALGVANAYLKTINLTKDIALKHNPKVIAILYKNAAYYAKFGGNFKLMFKCILKSLNIKICKENLIFLFVCLLPNFALKILSNLRATIKNRLKI